MPTFYECQGCTACCRWPGQVRQSDEEISELAAFLRLTERDFIQRYTRLRPDRQGLSLHEKANGDCILLAGDGCSVQPVKPQQCRGFPNLWNFPGFEQVCHAVPRAVTEAEQELLLDKLRQRPPSDSEGRPVCVGPAAESPVNLLSRDASGSP